MNLLFNTMMWWFLIGKMFRMY